MKIASAIGFSLVCSAFGVTEDKASFAGTISATLARGQNETTSFVFTRKGNRLRIENATNQRDPINIVDLAANRLTIIYPHNTTFVHIDLTKKAAQPGGRPENVRQAWDC